MTTPTPAALRAAKALCEKWSIGESSQFCDDLPDFDHASERDIAETIDRETGLHEVTEAFRALIRTYETYTEQTCGLRETGVSKEARAVLARLEVK